MSTGRKPMGPALVEHLDGSERAKRRLEVILETIAGRLTIPEACDRLGIGPAMFHRLRIRALEASLAQLEPRAVGRPARRGNPQEVQEAQWQRREAELEAELHLAQVREEIAHVLPQLVREEKPAGKKTTHTGHRPRRRRPRRHRRRTPGAPERIDP